ncbi:hypothetical protein HZF05_18905 [Sphingomonas sp. CGMCC 1.13654]|uniref:Uncharacterized protein n=1 Tax=Sphingomonas chungangi TaxID=2683589 RepID=A0A838LAU9_9SPHN|nr:hypothetical protein [Sphingomonas chungangi]MBA2936157.1 hypothetical protein [Sphingomonas chungangi]MVW55543.1 hypothetical protein [Sphingomonas chungangi]
MAYLDTREAFTTAAPIGSSTIPAAFERSEWEVIVLAQRDDLASLRAPGWVARTFAALFGGNPDRRLASPRLEALRRLAVHAWHRGYAVPVSAMKNFKDAGFSPDQLELLLASVSQGRTADRRHA